jgi:hypothetical protein
MRRLASFRRSIPQSAPPEGGVLRFRRFRAHTTPKAAESISASSYVFLSALSQRRIRFSATHPQTVPSGSHRGGVSSRKRSRCAPSPPSGGAYLNLRLQKEASSNHAAPSRQWPHWLSPRSAQQDRPREQTCRPAAPQAHRPSARRWPAAGRPTPLYKPRKSAGRSATIPKWCSTA